MVVARLRSRLDRSEIPWSQGTFQIILGTMLTGVLGISIIAPALPTIRTALGLTGSQTGLILTVFTLPGILLAPLVGILADRYGRKRVLVPCLLLFGVAGVGVAFVDEYELIIGLRLLQGVGGSGLTTLAITLIGDFFDGQQRNAVMGINSAVLAVGTATFPVVGGVLAEFSWKAPFLTHGVGVLLGLVAIRSLEDPTLGATPRGFDYLQGAVAEVSLDDAVVLYGFAFTIFVTVYGVLLTTVPFLLRELHGMSSSNIGLMLTTNAAMSGLASSQNGRLAKYFSNEQLIVLGLTAYGISMLGMSIHTSAWSLVAPVMLFGIGTGLSVPSLNTAVSELTTDKYRGGAISLRTSVIRFGQSAGPVMFPTIVVVADFRPTLLGTAIVVLVVTVVVWATRVRGGK